MQETFQAIGTIGAGKATKAQAYSEAALAERQAQDVDLQALQTSEARRAELRSAMSTIEARRAAANVGMDTPSGDAIRREIQRQSARAESIDRVGYGNQKTALNTSAVLKRQYGKSALTVSKFTAASDFMKSIEAKAAAAAGAG